MCFFLLSQLYFCSSESQQQCALCCKVQTSSVRGVRQAVGVSLHVHGNINLTEVVQHVTRRPLRRHPGQIFMSSVSGCSRKWTVSHHCDLS